MQPSHASFVPDLDLNPPVGWSKPASALGLSDPLKHLPQSQQVQRLQQQIQQHRHLQQSALQGHDKSRKGSSTGSRPSSKSPSHSQSLFDSNTRSGVSDASEDRISKTNNFRHSIHFGTNASEFGYVQHINIQNHHDEDSNMSGDDQEEDCDDGGNCTDSSANSIRGGMDIKTGPGHSNPSYHQYRSPTNTAHFSRGFTALHGFTPIISPGSNNSPPFSPGSESFTSDSGSAFGSSFPLHPPSGNNSYSSSNINNNNSNHSGSSNTIALESSLSSLAALSVMADPMFRRSLSSGNTSQPSQNTLPGMYQDHHQTSFEMGSRTGSNSLDSMQTFTSALGQQLQREQQQQQQQQQQHGVSSYQQPTSSVPTLSVSLPAPSTFEQYREQSMQQQQQQQQQKQQQKQQPQESESAVSMSSRRQGQPLIPPRRRNVPVRQPQATAPRKYHGRQMRQAPIVTNIVKEVVTPTRRMAHILSEQKRREKINGGFDELKSVIPECADNTDSKASILRKAVDYICLLEDEIRKYVEVYEPDQGGDFGDQGHCED
ncbi:hypothetical protein EC968_010212 [Mortierella alpina]|nr:hypothetical protein EC968_010212 [Mortierella alpina]